jgi:hypothetical protein
MVSISGNRSDQSQAFYALGMGAALGANLGSAGGILGGLLGYVVAIGSDYEGNKFRKYLRF